MFTFLRSMGLRFKTALTISCFFVAVIAATYLLFSYVLLSEFDRLERERAERNMTRVFEQLEGVTEDLRTRVIDWAQWDETYAYLAGQNKTYIETNVSYEALVPFELIHVAFLDSKKNLLEGFQISSADRSITSIDRAAFAALAAYPSIAAFLTAPQEQPLGGIVVLDNQPLFVAIAAVTDNERKNPSNGFLIFTRAFSESLKTQIAKRTKLPLSFPQSLPESVHSTLSITTSNHEITARATIADIENHGVMDIAFSSPREIYQQGKTSRNVMVALMAAFLVIANGILLFFLNKVVLGRLEKFAIRIKAITATRDYSVRAPADGHDEITDLTRTFNALIETTEKTTLQLTEARNHAVRADRAKSAFVAHVSHELRTPIHSLSGLLRILLKTEETPHKRNLIQMARESAATLLLTINDILDLSKIESGALELQRVEYSLREILQNSLRNVAIRIEEKGGIAILFDVAPGVPDKLVGDPLRVQQVLTNLLSNAAKFTHQGSITLAVKIQQGSIRSTLELSVADTGIGIAPDQLERIFEPYKQADPSIEARFAGTGLGLSIVRQILTQLGGTIAVESVVNQGTVFTVSLPLEIADGTIRSPEYPPRSALIISDDESSADFLMRHLAPFNCSAERRSSDTSVAELEHYVTQRAPDVVLFLGHGYHSSEELRSASLLAQRCASPCFITVGDSDVSTLNELKSKTNLMRFPNPLCAEELLHTAFSLSAHRNSFLHEEPLTLSPSPSPMRILVADDAPTSQIILKDMLEEAGHTVIVVSDGMELVRVARESFERHVGGEFDAIISDIEMPRLTGMEAAKEIRSLESRSRCRSRVPIIAITAHALSDQRAQMLEAGITSVLPKPISPKVLDDELRKLQTRNHPVTYEAKDASPSERDVLETVIRQLPTAHAHDSANLSPPVDIPDIFERSGESLRRTKMIMKSFLDAYNTPTLTLQSSIEKGDLSEAVIPAHSVKGLLLDVGAKDAAATAASLETASRAGDREKALLDLEKLSDQLRFVVRALEEALHHHLLMDIK
jgi:two-component system sensor histidine kinase/response regulator